MKYWPFLLALLLVGCGEKPSSGDMLVTRQGVMSGDGLSAHMVIGKIVMGKGTVWLWQEYADTVFIDGHRVWPIDSMGCKP